MNSRLDEMQAAILRVKLRHLSQDNERRERLAQVYLDALKGSCLRLPAGSPEGVHAWHLFVVAHQHRDKLLGFSARTWYRHRHSLPRSSAPSARLSRPNPVAPSPTQYRKSCGSGTESAVVSGASPRKCETCGRRCPGMGPVTIGSKCTRQWRRLYLILHMSLMATYESPWEGVKASHSLHRSDRRPLASGKERHI